MNRCLEARQALALTQVQFAGTIGVHPISISRYERGEEPIPRVKQALFHFIVHATDKERDFFLERFCPMTTAPYPTAPYPTIRAKIICDSIGMDPQHHNIRNSGEGIIAPRLTTFELTYPRYIHAELMTNRAYCISGDAVLDFDLPSAQGRGDRRLYRMTVRSFVDKWLYGAASGKSSRHNGRTLNALEDGAFYSVQDVAEELGFASTMNLNQVCREGKIPGAEKLEGTWMALGHAWKEWRESTGRRRFSLRSRLQAMHIRQVNERTGEMQHAHVKDVIVSGTKQVYRLHAGDYSVVATADHRILTEGGWARLGDLIVGKSRIVTYKYGSGVKPDPYRKIDGVWVCRWNASVRDAVAARQNFKCHISGEGLRETFHIHHVISRHERPDLAFDLSNVVAVNEEAHRELHGVQGWQQGVMLGVTFRTVDEITPEGEVDTYDLEIDGEFPNFIADGIVVHNSRNAQSSRAIPVRRRLERVRENPVMPIRWGAEQKGMQAKDVEVDDPEVCKANWLDAAAYAADAAEILMQEGLHKQWANRLLEPFDTITTIVTATSYENSFALRCDPDAQPEYHNLAWKMADLYYNSEPTVLKPGEWHLPYVWKDNEDYDFVSDEDLIKASVARCARVSYLNHDGSTPDIGKDIALHDMLFINGHMSPFEHQAKVGEGNLKPHLHGNLAPGWIQYRKTLPREIRTFDYHAAVAAGQRPWDETYTGPEA